MNRAAAVCPLLLVLAAAAMAVGAEDERPQGWEEVEARKKANTAADLLTSTLLLELNAALKQGEPVKALGVCRKVAQEITAEMSRREGVVVRRTSLRLRNSANRPDDFERAWLEEAERTIGAGGVPAPVYKIDWHEGQCELRHVRPIWFPGGPCSQCHGRGDEIGADVRRALQQHYPGDQATGFAPGDLRGAISVRVSVREPCSVEHPPLSTP